MAKKSSRREVIPQQFPPSNTPVLNPNGTFNETWYRYFVNSFSREGGSQDDIWALLFLTGGYQAQILQLQSDLSNALILVEELRAQLSAGSNSADLQRQIDELTSQIAILTADHGLVQQASTNRAQIEELQQSLAVLSADRTQLEQFNDRLEAINLGITAINLQQQSISQQILQLDYEQDLQTSAAQLQQTANVANFATYKYGLDTEIDNINRTFESRVWTSITATGGGLTWDNTTGTLSSGTAAAANTGTSGHVLGFMDGVNTYSGATTFSSTVTLAADPTTPLGAATKQYVDNTAAGLNPKASCRVATTANITLSGTQTIDGVAVVAGDRVLAKNQTTQADNGIYVVASGSWARSSDMDSWAEVPSANVWIKQGTTEANTAWVCTSPDGGTLGTTAITWVQFGGTGAYAPLNSPAFTGSPTAPTPTAGDNSTNIATTAFVTSATVAKAVQLATSRTIALTGDGTATGSFDGSANYSAAFTLATVNSNTGSFGSSTAIPNFTVNNKGLMVAAGTSVVIAPAGTLSGATLASGVTASSLTSLGALTGLTMAGAVNLVAGTATVSPLVLAAGTSLTTLAAGAVEWDGTSLFVTQTTGPTRKTVAFTDSALTGNTTGSAAKWTTARTLTLGTDLTGSVSFDGSASFTLNGTIATGAVTPAKLSTGAPAWTTAGIFTVTQTAAASNAYQRIANTSGTANSTADLSLDPGGSGYNSRDAIIRATNNGSNQITLSFLVANGSTPATALTILPDTTVTFNGAFRALPLTVSGLPSASGRTNNSYLVTDASAPTTGSIVAGGGSSRALVISDGTNWRCL